VGGGVHDPKRVFYIKSEKVAIVLLPAGIKQQDGTWVSTDLSEADAKLGAPGGKLRVIAAAELMKENPDALLVTGGALGFDVPVGTTSARPMLADILFANWIFCVCRRHFCMRADD